MFTLPGTGRVYGARALAASRLPKTGCRRVQTRRMCHQTAPCLWPTDVSTRPLQGIDTGTVATAALASTGLRVRRAPHTGRVNMRLIAKPRRSAGKIRGAARARRLNFRLVLATAALGLALPSAASAAQSSYVALGDSYTSAFGVMPLAPTAPPECGQSTLNYPHLTASALNLSLTEDR